MRQIQKSLMISFIGLLLFALLIIVAYESGCVEPGAMADDKVGQFWLQLIMEVLTIGLIPLALRLFKFGKVRTDLKNRGEKSLLMWAMIRMDMLFLPMIANALFYEMTLSPAFGYLGIILFLCIFLIAPTNKRCEGELTFDDNDKA